MMPSNLTFHANALLIFCYDNLNFFVSFGFINKQRHGWILNKSLRFIKNCNPDEDCTMTTEWKQEMILLWVFLNSTPALFENVLHLFCFILRKHLLLIFHTY